MKTFNTIKSLARTNDFYVAMYDFGNHTNYNPKKFLIKVTKEQLIDELKLSDDRLGVSVYVNTEYFKNQPTNDDDRFNVYNKFMAEQLTLLNPHTQLTIEDEDGDVYVVQR